MVFDFFGDSPFLGVLVCFAFVLGIEFWLMCIPFNTDEYFFKYIIGEGDICTPDKSMPVKVVS